MMFTFTALHDRTLLSHGASRIRVPALAAQTHDPAYYARFRGALLARFGPPLATSTDAGDAFVYWFLVTTDAGASWMMTAYEGPSGSAFGARDPYRDKVIAAATALLAILDATQPADFEVVLASDEYEAHIRYGCHDGACYWHETTLDLTD